MAAPELARRRLVTVTLDERSIARGTPDQEHERATAVYDLLEENAFCVPGHDAGPYALVLGLQEARLAFDVRDADGAPVCAHLLSLSPFRRILKDYFMMCESYYSAIRTASPSRIEAIDMGRRALHNEGAEVLRERLQGKIECDFDTARRLFTLVTALHWKG
jgi:uncharacterized protein (UPF0262 family)